MFKRNYLQVSDCTHCNFFVCDISLHVEKYAHCYSLLSVGYLHVANTMHCDVNIRGLHMNIIQFLGQYMLHIHVSWIPFPHVL